MGGIFRVLVWRVALRSAPRAPTGTPPSGKTFVVPLWIWGRATRESSVVEPSYLGEATGAMGEDVGSREV